MLLLLHMLSNNLSQLNNGTLFNGSVAGHDWAGGMEVKATDR